MKNMKALKALLIVIAVVCIGVAVSYPIRYKMELDSNNSELEDLSGMRRRVMEEQHVGMVADEWEPAPAEEELPGEQTPPADGPLPTEGPIETEATTPTEGPPPTEVPPPTEGPSPTEALSETGGPTETEETTPTEAPSQTEAPTVTGQTTPTEAPSETEGPSPEETAHTSAEPSGTQPPAQTVTHPPVMATPIPDIRSFLLEGVGITTPSPKPSSTPTPTPSPTPSPTPDRHVKPEVDSFKDKAKVRLDESRILPELREIYALNHDLVGWLYIEDTNIDYPVVQSEDGKFYLKHDFYGKSNANGQIILEDKCDPYTPSYNLVLSGHHMNSGAMFGRLGYYKDRAYWETHKIVEFDTLMARKRYVVFAAFYSADYDEYEEGFRYSADIQYKLDAEMWLQEIRDNQIYETGIQTKFGDEFITLTTCDHSRRHDGRFVVVARRIREGESIQ